MLATVSNSCVFMACGDPPAVTAFQAVVDTSATAGWSEDTAIGKLTTTGYGEPYTSIPSNPQNNWGINQFSTPNPFFNPPNLSFGLTPGIPADGTYDIPGGKVIIKRIMVTEKDIESFINQSSIKEAVANLQSELDELAYLEDREV